LENLEELKRWGGGEAGTQAELGQVNPYSNYEDDAKGSPGPLP